MINKMDVLREVGTWTVRDDNGTIENISDEKLFRRFLKSQIPENIAVYFSESHIPFDNQCISHYNTVKEQQ